MTWGICIGDVLISLLLVGLTGLAVFLYNLLWLKPERLRKKLQMQGINGPPPSFFYGNLPDIKRISSQTAKMKAPPQEDNRVSHSYMSYIVPHLQKWRADYGPVFVYSMGNMVIVHMSDFDLVREFCQCKSIEFGRPSFLRKNRGALLGNSIVSSIGPSWVYQRKIIAPEFFLNKVKGMVDMMVESAISMVKVWEDKSEEEGGIASIRVDEDLKSLSAEIISKACFGSSYVQGNEIFATIRAIQDLLSRQSAFLGLPGLRYIPTKSNREVWRLSGEIRTSILKLMEDHKLKGTEKDLLQVLMKSFSPDGGGGSGGSNTNAPLIVDNCKAIFFAGHGTTSTAAAFTLVLLAHHPEWQKRVRDEVAQVCADQVLNVDMLHKMKTLTMVIHETLRLYPAAPFSTRETTEEMKFGHFLIPKGVNIWIPVATLHQDPTNWGADAGEFNPERFANGISGACKLPHLYMPFGTGLRSCVGQNFATIQLKILLSLILSKFTFSLSPDYRHSIAYKLTTAPENGVSLLMERN